jgi:hypothetical protein
LTFMATSMPTSECQVCEITPPKIRTHDLL